MHFCLRAGEIAVHEILCAMMWLAHFCLGKAVICYLFHVVNDAVLMDELIYR